jgi:hypothetical protein
MLDAREAGTAYEYEVVQGDSELVFLLSESRAREPLG